MDSYSEFIKRKMQTVRPVGFDAADYELSQHLFPFQQEIVFRTVKLGRAAIFAECGLGKTLMQLNWAEIIAARTAKPVLIVAPLCVSEQTQEEAKKFGIDIARLDADTDAECPISITNYERLHKLNLSQFAGVVLDESSILKNYTAKTRTMIIESFGRTPYKLACTATPAPNDHMELGNHSEFLGVKSRTEMLAEYFVHDGGETQVWRLKRHAVTAFWRWVREWAIIAGSPKDLGYDAEGFDLPEISTKQILVRSSNYSDQLTLFPLLASTLTERRRARKSSIEDRISAVESLVSAESPRPWLIWCNLNDEASALQKALPTAIEIRGSHTLEQKKEKLLKFLHEPNQILITKPSIAGFGLNFQHCARMIWCGLSDSFEEYYQGVRRVYRFGQQEEVKVFIVLSDAEQNVVRNVLRKQEDFNAMRESGIYA